MRATNEKGWAVALCLGASVLVGSAAQPAHACIEVVVFTVDKASQDIARADRALEQGRPVVAYRVAHRTRRELEAHRRTERDPNADRLIARALRITAVAVVRLDGQTPITSRAARRGVVRGRQDRSLRWALGQLREVRAQHPNDPVAEAQYAEALARFPEHRAEARTILTRLAERDLMPGAHGYATLARLLDRSGPLFSRALDRCQAMSPDHADRICPSFSS
jgi:hypothetical protein